MSCVLPEDLLVDILSERLKVCGVGEKETFLLQRDSTGVQLGEEEERRRSLHAVGGSWTVCREPWGKLPLPLLAEPTDRSKLLLATALGTRMAGDIWVYGAAASPLCAMADLLFPLFTV